jgi:hypothetical protein
LVTLLRSTRKRRAISVFFSPAAGRQHDPGALRERLSTRMTTRPGLKLSALLF